MIARAVVCPQLVARTDELETLSGLRRAAAQGHGGLVLIEGDAGIGKSRLVGAFRETLTNGRAAVGVGRCREFGNVPYGPVHEALRSLGGAHPVSGARDRSEYLAALHDRLVGAAERRFIVVVLEDLHWADDGSLRFISHALPSLGNLRALIVATYRTEEVESESVATSYVARFARDSACRRIKLRPLSRTDTRRMVVLASRSHPSLGRAEVDAIVERSEGNPFFAEELLKSALEQGERKGSGRGLPLTIRSLVDERLRRLDDRFRRIIALASVIGRSFDAELLARIAEVELARVLEALRHARDLQLVEESSLHPARYAFRHALTREAIYDGMLAAESRPLHMRILAALEHVDKASVQDLGYHAWAAREAAACLRYNERAGDDADALHAYADAVRCYERAMLGAPDDAVMARLLGKAAASSARDGDVRRAFDLYDAAAQACERHGDTEGAVGNYQMMSSQARVAGDNERAMVILQRALRMSPGQDTVLHARLGVTLAHLFADRGDVAAASEMLQRCGAARDTANYHNARAYLGMVRGDVAIVLDASADFIAACSPEGDRVMSARFNEAFGLAALGYDVDALAKIEAMLPELHERRLNSLEVLACANAALVLARQGRLDDARRFVERALGVPEPNSVAPIALASAALVVGRALDDERLVARSVTPAIVEAAFASRINSTLGRIAGPYARWLSARGQDEEAASVLRRAMALLTVPFASTDTLVAAAELGDQWTRSRALDFLTALDGMPAVPLYVATASHLRALGARLGADGTGPRYAHEAAQRYAALAWPLLEASCLEIAGEHGRAAERFAATGAVFEVRRLATAGPARTRSSPLSTRERDIAMLIARGAPNKMLAERFAVNQRTIEKHLTSIYVKLGLRNRSELAAFVARGYLTRSRSSAAEDRSGRASRFRSGDCTPGVKAYSFTEPDTPAT